MKKTMVLALMLGVFAGDGSDTIAAHPEVGDDSRVVSVYRDPHPSGCHPQGDGTDLCCSPPLFGMQACITWESDEPDTTETPTQGGSTPDPADTGVVGWISVDGIRKMTIYSVD